MSTTCLYRELQYFMLMGLDCKRSSRTKVPCEHAKETVYTVQRLRAMGDALTHQAVILVEESRRLLVQAYTLP